MNEGSFCFQKKVLVVSFTREAIEIQGAASSVTNSISPSGGQT